MKTLKNSVIALILVSSTPADTFAQTADLSWIAGDHHIHSRYSVGWNREVNPPTPIRGGDAIYPIHMNALMAKYFGLGWMVSTDHGGPGHSKVNLETAYPELLQSRKVVPEVIQFYGMEFDTPGADHSSLIIPFSDSEAQNLFSIESKFAKREPWPADANWDSEPRMLDALRAMQLLPQLPLLIANHPSRSAPEIGVYGADTPAELRNWNNTAPRIAVGMAGAPGHQASALNPDGSLDPLSPRGGYSRAPTLGGFDQFTAIVGGFWDSMIGEGRDWWITANSDSHVHFSEGGSDFWPGEYSKTYVWAEPNHSSIMNGIRSGNIFVTTGDLIDELYVNVTNQEQSVFASIGDTASTSADNNHILTIRFSDPDTPNYNGDNPMVTRVDVIMGELSRDAVAKETDSNPTTQVIKRFTISEMSSVQLDGKDYQEIRFELPRLSKSSYLRVRGTNSAEQEPSPDERGENPWSDLWFYSNPIRLELN